MPDLAFDFVYSPKDEFTFANLHITLSVAEKANKTHYELTITSEANIADRDIIAIISELNKKKFERMNIETTENCKIFLSVEGKVREINLAHIKANMG